MVTMGAALQAKEVAKRILSEVPGVNGIGITWNEEGDPCVRVNVNYEMAEESRKRIPSSVQGVPVVVEEIGDIETE